MLIELAVSNFRSIKDRQVLSMLPAGKIKLDEHPDNIIKKNSNQYDLALLKSTVFYGANASGKSNFLKAFRALEYLVENSMNFRLDQSIPRYEPFKLDTITRNKPVEFEIDFIANDKLRYLYKIVFAEKEFLHESLHFYPKKQKSRLFVRDGQSISFSDYFKEKGRYKLLKNQLLLSMAGITPIESLQSAYRFFSKSLFNSMIHDTEYDEHLIRQFGKLIAEKKGSHLRDNINRLIRAADTGIKSITTKELSLDDSLFPEALSEDVKRKIVESYKYSIKTIHNLFENDKPVGDDDFDITEESAGTIKLLAVGIFILEALSNGTTIIIDELDKSLHPELTRMLIRLFHSEATNPNNAQLVFATHDVSLLDSELFRRDQIWLTNKNTLGSTEIYPLSDFTGISKVKPLDNWYLRGRFGGVPVLKDFRYSLELSDETNQKN